MSSAPCRPGCARLALDVRIVMPLYKQIKEKYGSQLHFPALVR